MSYELDHYDEYTDRYEKTCYIRVSRQARDKIREKVAKNPELYKGRGLLGVVDLDYLGYFSTSGSGRHKAS